MSRSFNGSADKIEADPSPTYSQGTPYSIAAWVQNNSSGAGNRTIFINNNVGSNQTYLRIGDATANKPEFGFWNGSVNHRAVGASTLSINTWYQLTGTYDGSTYNLYTNGTVASSSDAVAPSFTVLTTSIGWDFANGSRFWNGLIADLAIWSVALTAGEASALNNGARPYTIRPSALNGYWPLDGLQSPEPDISGKIRNGTLTGTALAAGPPIMPFTPRWGRFIGWTPLLPAAGLGWIINRRNRLKGNA